MTLWSEFSKVTRLKIKDASFWRGRFCELTDAPRLAAALFEPYLVLSSSHVPRSQRAKRSAFTESVRFKSLELRTVDSRERVSRGPGWRLTS
jgi:hypothetical protein